MSVAVSSPAQGGRAASEPEEDVGRPTELSVAAAVLVRPLRLRCTASYSGSE